MTDVQQVESSFGGETEVNVSAILSSLTDTQKKVYEAIKKAILKNGFPPTVREIGKMVGNKTPGAVQGILRRLELKGAIKRQGGLARSIQLVEHYISDGGHEVPDAGVFRSISSEVLGSGTDCLVLQHLKNDTLIVKAGQVKQNDVAVVEHGQDILVGYLFEEDGNVVVKASPTAKRGHSFKRDEANVLGRLVGKYAR